MNQPPEELLQKLPGLPLTKATRNGAVQYFHFGKAHVKNSSGLILDVGEFTLAVVCSWHLLHKGKTVTSFPEMYLPKFPDMNNFDWKVPGSNLRDAKLMDLINNSEPDDLKVEEVRLFGNFGLELYFQNGLQLQLVPQKTASKEPDLLWSLFNNTDNSQSIACTTKGIQISLNN